MRSRDDVLLIRVLAAGFAALTIALIAPLAATACGKHQARTVFRDDFNTLDQRIWHRGLWFEAQPPPGDSYVSRGVLHLTTKRSEGYIAVHLSTHPARAFKQGYFEARIKVPAGNGSRPAFWLMSNNWMATGDCTVLKNSELDIMDNYGSTPTFLNFGLHSNTSNNCGETDQIRWPYYFDTKKVLSNDWHLYAARWTKTYVAWYVDGRQVASVPTYASTDQPMAIQLSSYAESPDASTPDVLDMQVDWVRVW
jgi:hypothetical protein